MLKNFLAASVLVGGMLATPAPVQAEGCFGICIISSDWVVCVFIC